jgi:RimJ/RimL family protein N-acetyltransferase
MPVFDLKPFTCRADYERMVDYFLQSDVTFLRCMGIDPAKLPTRDAWLARLLPDLDLDDREKQTYYLGWFYDEAPIGHCNVNQISYQDAAYMHLHSWNAPLRRSGLGTEFCRRAAREFMRKFALQRLYCEPCADNPAPNRVLLKLGFRLLKRYRTVPGLINFEQDVNQYVLERDRSSRGSGPGERRS